MKNKILLVSIFLACALLFSLFTVFSQVTDLSLRYLETSQVNRHLRVLEGNAGTPYQYRVLSEYVVKAVILTLTNLGFPHPVTAGFILFRVFQNTIIFLLVSFYYKKLGLSSYVTLIGISLLAWAMTHSGYDADLTFNLFSDIIFYLTAALAILHNRAGLIIPIVGFAAFNRETSGLIPLMLIVHSFYTSSDRCTLKREALIAIIALGVYCVVFFGLRYIYGQQPLVLPYGNHPGLELFKYNMVRYMTWVQLFATLGIIPVLALVSTCNWPRTLRAFFWAIIPIWAIVHPFVSIMAEARLFLVPLTLIFIPGALFGILTSDKEFLLPHEHHQEALAPNLASANFGKALAVQQMSSVKPAGQN